jgi:hypothetical protein
VPFGSRVARTVHFIGGGIVGAWIAPLFGCILAAPASIIFAIIVSLLGGLYGAAIGAAIGGLIVGLCCLATPVFCVRAGLVAVRGEPLAPFVRDAVHGAIDILRRW